MGRFYSSRSFMKLLLLFFIPLMIGCVLVFVSGLKIFGWGVVSTNFAVNGSGLGLVGSMEHANGKEEGLAGGGGEKGGSGGEGKDQNKGEGEGGGGGEGEGGGGGEGEVGGGGGGGGERDRNIGGVGEKDQNKGGGEGEGGVGGGGERDRNIGGEGEGGGGGERERNIGGGGKDQNIEGGGGEKSGGGGGGVDGGGREKEGVMDVNSFSHDFVSPLPPIQVGHDVTGEEINSNISYTRSNELEMAKNETKPNNVRRVLTRLEKLEAALQRSRAAIKEASYGEQIHDSDYVPFGPMYHDAKAFHRSYLEMEKQFKVYVYKEGEAPLFHNGPCKSIYSMEGNFINKMDINTRFRTNDPEKAHVFYLPFSISKMVRFVYERDTKSFRPIRKTIVDYIDLIGRKYPYWNRSLGADHFMLACHDWGPEASFSLPYLEKNSIRALCNANMSEKFNPTKDVSIPEINLQTERLTGLLGGPSPSHRPILAFFAGGVHGPIRPVLLEHWENKNDEDVKVQKYLPKGVNYQNMMRKSKYCLCPSGYEVASPRIVEALYSGCVPVLISVGYVPPFSDVLNWKSFSVEVSVDDIPNLKNILTSISTSQYIRMYRRVLKVRRHFVFNSPPQRFDVFHMILHSVWLRRLNIRIREYE